MKKIALLPIVAILALGACNDGGMIVAPAEVMFHNNTDQPEHNHQHRTAVFTTNVPAEGFKVGNISIAWTYNTTMTASPSDQTTHFEAELCAGENCNDGAIEGTAQGAELNLVEGNTAEWAVNEVGWYTVRVRSSGYKDGSLEHASVWKTISFEVFDPTPGPTYFINGFSSPVRNGMTVRGGSTVPLQFHVFEGEDATGTEVDGDHSAAGGVDINIVPVACDGVQGAVEEVGGNAGATGLRYEDGRWIRNWRTPRLAGCFDVTPLVGDQSGETVRINTR